MSKVIPYFDFYPSAFMHGVRGLTPQEVGVYTMLLCRIYEENGPVEYHTAKLATYCGMREASFEKIFARLVDLGKLTVENGAFTNDRAQQEIASRETRLKSNSRAGKASAEKRKQNQIEASTRAEQNANHKDRDIDKKKGVTDVTPCAADLKSPSFDEFWSVWPLGKVAKDAARKAYGRLSPQQRIGATAHAAEWCRSWRAANPRLNDIHPATYLNNKRWNDEIQQPFTVIAGGPRDQSPRFNRETAASDALARRLDAAARTH